MTASQGRGGGWHCGPRDGTGHRCRELGNGVECTLSWAHGGRHCCELGNGITGLGMVFAWSTASSTRVEEDGGA
jgi:hypothetical protein